MKYEPPFTKSMPYDTHCALAEVKKRSKVKSKMRNMMKYLKLKNEGDRPEANEAWRALICCFFKLKRDTSSCTSPSSAKGSHIEG
jgi:hypothetical protein